MHQHILANEIEYETVSSITLPITLNYLDILKTFIDKDITVAINGNANYLAALGLCTYTEILGGLYSGDLINDLGKHYLQFIKDFFPQEYILVDTNLKQDGFCRGLYEVVRSGLTHEYFIKSKSKVEIDNTHAISSGIMYDSKSNPQIIFYVRRYFKDFNDAFLKYYEKLKTDPAVLVNFVNAHTNAKSSLINDMNTNFSSAVSGGWSGGVYKRTGTP